MESHAPPALSVIVPARNSPAHLRSCLESLRASTFTSFELLVVDDASTDDTPEVAAAFGARLLRRAERGGPGSARNTGAQEARGAILFFVDADVCVRPDTLARVMEAFALDPSVDALFGSYDQSPSAPNLLSQFRNLLHHHVHQEGNAEASTFWAGCGAIKRSVFQELEGFDVRYGRPSVEDIELGSRLRKAGRKVILAKDLQVKHLKRWTLWSMLVVDVRDRAVPWTELMLREGHVPDDLNLRLRHRVSAALAYGLIFSLVIGAWYLHGILLLPVLAILSVLMVDYWSDARASPRALHVLAVLMALGAVVLIAFYFQMWVLVALACLLGIVLVNFRFYALVARERHPILAAFVVPLHILFYLYSGVGFGLGVVRHLTRGGRERPRPAVGDRP